jgi:hypothetical protein
MKPIFHLMVLVVVVLTATQCTTPSYTVPHANIPAKAWKPGDVGEVKVKLYVYEGGSYHYLQDSRHFAPTEGMSDEELKTYGIITLLQPGDRIKVTQVQRYPMSTVDDVDVRGVVINGPHAGMKVSVSSPLCNAVGEFWGPNPKKIARVGD